jgi:hypothetical protein
LNWFLMCHLRPLKEQVLFLRGLYLIPHLKLRGL